MRIELGEETIRVQLAPWQKALGLMGSVEVPRADVSEVHIVEDGVAEAMQTGVKVGLRLPWLYYAARTIQLDEMLVVRRGVPALSLAVSNQGKLKRILLSTPDARELARRLGASG